MQFDHARFNMLVQEGFFDMFKKPEHDLITHNPSRRKVDPANYEQVADVVTSTVLKTLDFGHRQTFRHLLGIKDPTIKEVVQAMVARLYRKLDDAEAMSQIIDSVYNVTIRGRG